MKYCISALSSEPEEVIVVGAEGAAVAAAIASAIKASGVLVRVSSTDFQNILRKVEKPLVIYATGGLFTSNYQYLTSYKGSQESRLRRKKKAEHLVG